MNVWKGLKIGVKIMEIKSVEMHLINAKENNYAQHLN